MSRDLAAYAAPGAAGASTLGAPADAAAVAPLAPGAPADAAATVAPSAAPPLPFYHVAAFVSPRAARCASGNAAAVVLARAPLGAAAMQALAAELALSETAFVSPAAGGGAGVFDLRWFTPAREVALCGHGTLAAAAALAAAGDAARAFVFHTLSGPLAARRAGARAWALELPAAALARAGAGGAFAAGEGPPAADVAAVLAALWAPAPPPRARALAFCARSRKLLVDATGEGAAAALRAAAPAAAALLAAAPRSIGGVAVVAECPGDADADVEYRYWSPWNALPGAGGEDPVNGSSLTLIGPYFAAREGGGGGGGAPLRARAASARGGAAAVRYDAARGVVEVTGEVDVVVEGRVFMPE